jgi:hypothetical protein
MAKRIPEEKLAEQIGTALENIWFNPHIVASILVNNYSLYHQDKLIELMAEVIKKQSDRFKHEWVEHEQTSEGLMLANHLAEIIEIHGK